MPERIPAGSGGDLGDPGFYGVEPYTRRQIWHQTNAGVGWGARADSDDAIASFVRRNSMTTYHYTSTARLGTNPADSVLDLDFRVRGVSGLRVGDASAIPIGPVSAMNAPSMLVAWRAADALVADRR